jgi:hypothetical protein
MALNAVTLAENVAAMDVDGLTLYDLGSVPQTLDTRKCPLAYPVPEKFLVLEDATQLTFGERALWQYTYLVTFRYVEAPAGKERGLSKILPGKAGGYARFIQAITRNAPLLGAAYVRPVNTPEWGTLQDPSGQQFEAADLALRVVEYSAD